MMLKLIKYDEKIIIRLNKKTPYHYLVSKPAKEDDDYAFMVKETGNWYTIVAGYGVYPGSIRMKYLPISDILFDKDILGILEACYEKYNKTKLVQNMSEVGIIADEINELIKTIKGV